MYFGMKPRYQKKIKQNAELFRGDRQIVVEVLSSVVRLIIVSSANKFSNQSYSLHLLIISRNLFKFISLVHELSMQSSVTRLINNKKCVDLAVVNLTDNLAVRCANSEIWLDL